MIKNGKIDLVIRFFGSSQKFHGLWVLGLLVVVAVLSVVAVRTDRPVITPKLGMCCHRRTHIVISTSHSPKMQLFTIVVLAFLAVAAAFMPVGNIAR